MDDGFAASKYLANSMSKDHTNKRSTYTIPFFMSTPLMPLVTSHFPDVRNRGVPVLAGLKSAIWLKPSGVGTISRYPFVPPTVRFDGSR